MPVTSVPMKLPCTTFPYTVPVIRTPSPPLPEMTLRAPGAVPPIVLSDALLIDHAVAHVAQDLGAGDVGADEVALDQVAVHRGR